MSRLEGYDYDGRVGQTDAGWGLNSAGVNGDIMSATLVAGSADAVFAVTVAVTAAGVAVCSSAICATGDCRSGGGRVQIVIVTTLWRAI